MLNSRRVAIMGLMAVLAAMLVSSWFINHLPPDTNATTFAIANAMGTLMFVSAVVVGTVTLIAVVPRAVRAFRRALNGDL